MPGLPSLAKGFPRRFRPRRVGGDAGNASAIRPAKGHFVAAGDDRIERTWLAGSASPSPSSFSGRKSVTPLTRWPALVDPFGASTLKSGVKSLRRTACGRSGRSDVVT